MIIWIRKLRWHWKTYGGPISRTVVQVPVIVLLPQWFCFCFYIFPLKTIQVTLKEKWLPHSVWNRLGFLAGRLDSYIVDATVKSLWPLRGQNSALTATHKFAPRVYMGRSNGVWQFHSRITGCSELHTERVEKSQVAQTTRFSWFALMSLQDN